MKTEIYYQKDDLDTICDIAYKTFKNYNRRDYDNNLLQSEGITLDYLKSELFFITKDDLIVNETSKLKLYIESFKIIANKLREVADKYTNVLEMPNNSYLPYTNILTQIAKYEHQFETPYKLLVINETFSKINSDIIRMYGIAKYKEEARLLLVLLENQHKINTQVFCNATRIMGFLKRKFDITCTDDDLNDIIFLVETILTIE